MYYTLAQNNSGGSFDFNEEYGITYFIIIECDSKYDIEKRIEEILDYPNRGGDCPCCGDRWDSFIWDDELSEEPQVYGRPIEKTINKYFGFEAGKQICIHYKDGRKEWF